MTFDLRNMSTNEVLRALTKPVKKGKRGRMPTKNRTEWGWKYPDGREVCDTTAKGKLEYHTRTMLMGARQNFRCAAKDCGVPMSLMNGRQDSITFDHGNTRGMGGAWRDDRIDLTNDNGEWINTAMCWRCNSEKGSKRI